VNKSKSTVALLLVLSFILPSFSLPVVNAVEDSWVTLEPMPTARSGFGVAVVDGKVYAIGGGNGSYLNTNEMYDPATNTWTTKKSMPTARVGHAIAVYQNKVYVIGGIIGESDPVSSGYTGVNEVYDPLTDTWETMEPMPTARAHLDANVVNDNIYLIGGSKYGGLPLTFSQGTDGLNEVYDPLHDSWSTKTPRPPTDTGGYTSAVVDNKIHIMGGPNPGGPINVYNPETGKWISGFAANPNQIYNAETDIWTAGTPPPLLVFNAAAGATTGALAPKRIYILSGMGDQWNIATNLTQVYDPETDTWTIGTPIPTPRWSLGVAVVNDELYAIGGYDGDTHLAVNEKYTPAGYIPEFPSWVVLPLFFVVTLVGVAVRRKVFRST